jgi:hypothetical protein
MNINLNNFRRIHSGLVTACTSANSSIKEFLIFNPDVRFEYTWREQQVDTNSCKLLVCEKGACEANMDFEGGFFGGEV